MDDFTVDLDGTGFRAERIADLVWISIPTSEGNVWLRMTPVRAKELSMRLKQCAENKE